MLQVILLLVALVVLIYYYLIKPMHYWKEHGVTQASLSYIFNRNLDMFWKKKFSTAESIIIGYNLFPSARYTGAYQFIKPVLMIRDPDLIKDITVKHFEHFMDHTNNISEDADPLFAKNLVALRGQKWKDMRSILSPSLTSSKMRTMFVLMKEVAENVSNYFLKKEDDVIEIELKDVFSRFTTDIIASSAFGVKVDSLKDKNNEFFEMGTEFVKFSKFTKIFRFMFIMFFPKIAAFLKMGIFDKRTYDFFTRVVEDTIKVRKEKGIVRPDMIHLLMEAQKGTQIKEIHDSKEEGFATAQESNLNTGKDTKSEVLTNMDIVAQAVIFFLAGFETVSTSMCFTGYELAVNTECQKKLREEILQTFKECNGNVTYEALLKMKYLDMVISESLRKWSPALLTDRMVTKSFTIEPKNPGEQPVHLKEGMTCWFPVYAIHHDPKYYPEPDRFNPERFSDENKGNINPYTYFPFGLGPRNCIGSRFALLEIKVIFFYLLKNFEIVPVAKSDIPLKLSTRVFNLTAQNGFWCGLKRLGS